MKLPIIPQDKANHFIYGSVIFSIVFLLNGSTLSAFVSVLVIAFMKELYDALHIETNTPDLMDVLFTILGTFPPLLVLTM